MCSYLQIVLILNCCRLLVGAGTNILCENFPQKNLSGFLSPPDAITFLCGEFSKHIWTQRQENTKASETYTKIKPDKYIKNMSGFLSPPDAITFLCGELSKHIWTQRQENTIGRYEQTQIKTHKHRNCLVSTLSSQDAITFF